MSRLQCPVILISGGYSVGVPPLPIPNREVKPVRADGTAHPWESRSPPSFLLEASGTGSRGLSVFMGSMWPIGPMGPRAKGANETNRLMRLIKSKGSAGDGAVEDYAVRGYGLREFSLTTLYQIFGWLYH